MVQTDREWLRRVGIRHSVRDQIRAEAVLASG
jgi:hypothetical protein